MWCDELPPGKSWAALWTGYVLCGKCRAIRPNTGDCPVCGNPLYEEDGAMPVDVSRFTVENLPDSRPLTLFINHRPIRICAETVTGAELKALAMAHGLPIQPNHTLVAQVSDEMDRFVGDRDALQLHQDLQIYTVAPAFMGAEGRYEDWVYLRLLEREWKRPLTEEDRLADPHPTRLPSPRASIVVLFWTYLETRVERLLRANMRDVRPCLVEDTLQRYSSIGSRLDRLYRVLFQTTYWADLTEMGFDDIRKHLLKVQDRRNAFAHGDPSAIDDSLVASVVENLKREHEAWIAAYNRRATGG